MVGKRYRSSGPVCSMWNCPFPVRVWDMNFHERWVPRKAGISKVNDLSKKWVLRRETGRVRTRLWEAEERIQS